MVLFLVEISFFTDHNAWERCDRNIFIYFCLQQRKQRERAYGHIVPLLNTVHNKSVCFHGLCARAVAVYARVKSCTSNTHTNDCRVMRACVQWCPREQSRATPSCTTDAQLIDDGEKPSYGSCTRTHAHTLMSTSHTHAQNHILTQMNSISVPMRYDDVVPKHL